MFHGLFLESLSHSNMQVLHTVILPACERRAGHAAVLAGQESTDAARLERAAWYASMWARIRRCLRTAARPTLPEGFGG